MKNLVIYYILIFLPLLLIVILLDSGNKVVLGGLLIVYVIYRIFVDYYRLMAKGLMKKKDFFKDLMTRTSFKPLPSSGSYFQLYNYNALSQENEIDFAIRLTKEAGVTAIPVAAFYKEPVNNSVLRFCFAKKEDTLQAAAERLIQFEKK